MKEAISATGIVTMMMIVALHSPRKNSTTITTNKHAKTNVSTKEAIEFSMLSVVFITS